MRSLIAFILIVSVAFPVQAQSKRDSLLHLLRGKPQAKEKIVLYGKVSWSYIGEGAYDLATLYADSVRGVATEVHDSVGIYKADYYYGVIARFTGKYAAALDYFDRYLRFYVTRGDSSRVAGVLYQVGVVHAHYGNYEKSLAAYQRSLAIEEAAGNAYSVGYTQNAIGSVYSETGLIPDAIRMFNKALVIFDSLKEEVDKTDVLVNLANTYSEMKNFETAMKYYREALEIDKRTGKERGIAMSLANIAFLHDRMKAYDSALVYHLKALTIREKFEDAEYLTRSLIGVGRGYNKLGKFSDAEPYLKRALELSTRSNSKPLLRDVHLNLSDMYEGMKAADKARHHIKQYQLFQDSIFTEEMKKKVSELEVKHQVADKERQIALLTKEKQIQMQESARQATLRKVLMAGFIAVIALAAVVVYAFRQRLLVTRKEKEVDDANLRHQLSELKIKALSAQINPHFMFNCLNSINRMIVRGENDNASLYLKKFSTLVRLIVENGEANRVSLENELSLIESYIQLEELRFKNKIGYEIVVDEKIEKENIFLPPMILQPFVENSIWHGLMNKDGDEEGKIKIAVKEQDETLLCLIEDNGVGREKSRAFREAIPGKTQSVGINITEARLKLLARDQAQELIRIVDLKDQFDTATGTRVELRIPLY